MSKKDSSIRKPDKDSWVGLRPGSDHYRAYVGRPNVYDFISAMVFNLLTCIGLRQHHKVLDVGCGSLRVGRLLIPYLDKQGYLGVEPNKWLVDDGIRYEVGNDLIRIKEPTFSYASNLEEFSEPLHIDFAIAQSIFSHCSADLILDWLLQVAFHLNENGALLATFLTDDKDYEGENTWVYPGLTRYKTETIKGLASKAGLDFTVLDWSHPRFQTWVLFSKKKYDKGFIEDGTISWNRCVDKSIHDNTNM